MADVAIELEAIYTQGRPKIEFNTAAQNFSLGADFATCYGERIFDSLNIESIGLLTDGLQIEITFTSGKSIQFQAMPLASMSGSDTAVTVAFSEAIVGATQLDWNLQLIQLIEAKIHWE